MVTRTYLALASMTPSERAGSKGMSVLNSVWSKMAYSAHPELLNSPGMRELVIADSQHWGSGDKALGLINQMGGWDAINKMNPVDAINEYTNLRRSLWPGNSQTDSAHRLGREREWALKHATSSVIQYSPNVTVHVHGAHDATAVKNQVVEALRQHSEEIIHHVRRGLQENYRDEQRAGYA